jgi:NAD(P)-dependent dehydrogenase (short-subunit alcohol dehydrogenase family)
LRQPETEKSVTLEKQDAPGRGSGYDVWRWYGAAPSNIFQSGQRCGIQPEEDVSAYLAKHDLSGRRALVTGAAQGIGEACAEALAEAGAHVVVTDLDRSRAKTAAERLATKGLRAEARALDVTNSAALDALASALPALDVLVCNAGIVFNTLAEEMSDDEWERVIGVNLTGVFKTCRAFGRRMLQAGRGSIVNIGSMSADIVTRRSRNATTMLRRPACIT